MKKEKWTTNNIPNLSGKKIVVTGGSSGLGFESARVFALKGAEVIIASRSMPNMIEARQQIVSQYPEAKIELMEMDLADLDSVKKFATAFKKKYKQLDVLMNNAGVMTVPYESIKGGKESQLSTNHMGHFALTALLMDLIVSTSGSRVVIVSSLAHKAGEMDFDNLHFQTKKGYTPMKAYGRSKLANLMFMYRLQDYFEEHNIDSLAVAAHPGFSLTNLGRHVQGKFIFRLFGPLMKLMVQNPDVGALPQIRAAVDPKVKGGEFYGPAGFKEYSGAPVLVQSSAASCDQKDANQLWEVSEKLTGLTFSFES